MVFQATILHLQLNTGPGLTWAYEMIFVMSHAPIASARSLTRPVDQQSGLIKDHSLKSLFVEFEPTTLGTRVNYVNDLATLAPQDYIGSIRLCLAVD